MVQGEATQGGQAPEGPLRQELEAVLVDVDGRGLARELLGQLSQGGAVAQHAAAPLLGAGARGRAGAHACPPRPRSLGRQQQQQEQPGDCGFIGQRSMKRARKQTENVYRPRALDPGGSKPKRVEVDLRP